MYYTQKSHHNMVVLHCPRMKNYHSNGGYSDERVITAMKNDDRVIVVVEMAILA